MTHPERSTYIGGSDIAAIMGFDNYKTPLDVYNNKVHPDETPREINKKLDVGIRMEKFIAEMYQSQTKAHTVKEWPEKIIHPMYPFLGGHIDRMVFVTEDNTDVNKNQRILECKNTGGFASRVLWDEGLPNYYFTQVQFYLMLTNLQYADVAVLKDGWDFQIIEVERDEDFIEVMLQAALDFWYNHVSREVPPAAINIDDLKSMYPNTTPGKIIEANKEVESSIKELQDLKLHIKELKKKEELLEFSVKKYLEDSESVTFDGAVLATYKQNKDTTEIDYKKLITDLNIQAGVLINYQKVKRGSRILKIK